MAFREEQSAEAVHRVLLELPLEAQPVVGGQVDAAEVHEGRGLEGGVVESAVAVELAELEGAAEEELALEVEHPVAVGQLAQGLALVLAAAAQGEGAAELLLEVGGEPRLHVVEAEGVLLVLLGGRDAGEVGQVLDGLRGLVEVLEVGLPRLQRQW